jgi:hypothetical protein
LVLKTFECSRNPLVFRVEQAVAEPEGLSQESIIENMSAEEQERISRVRNIGIAVWMLLALQIPPEQMEPIPNSRRYNAGTYR